MKKFLLSLCVALLSVIAFAQNVVVVLKDGTEVKYLATDIDSIRIEKADSTQTDEEVVDAATSDFTFFILNDREAEVIGLNIGSVKVIVPEKVQIKGKVYTVTSIGSEAFRRLDKIKEFILPNTITNIGYRAFRDCKSLISINIPNSVTEIGEGAFEGCTSITSINIPNGVTKINDWTFADCASITSIEIPNSVTKIGEGAFADCISLTSLVISESVTEIGEEAFRFCESLTSIVIPNSVISIGYYAFWHCTNLTSIEIPESVTKIDSPFAECNNLKTARVPMRFLGKISFPDDCEIDWYGGDVIYTTSIQLVVGGVYEAQNDMGNFTFKVKSVEGSYLDKSQVVVISIDDYDGDITLSDAYASFIIYDGTKFVAAKMDTASENSQKVVMVLACMNSSANYTITSATLNDTLNSRGAIETTFRRLK